MGGGTTNEGGGGDYKCMYGLTIRWYGVDFKFRINLPQ